MNSQRAFAIALWTGLAGVVVMLVGLAVDATLHNNDHMLAQHESIWSLGNPGHLLLAAGMALVVSGISAATVLHVRAPISSSPDTFRAS
ncbi:MAG: hypothetical protein ABI912_09235 [Actinomycetota bacterium]